MTRFPTEILPVRGGELHYRLWGTRGPLILASHGITASHASFAPLARVLGQDYRLLAPDHRGRGRSANITGPWGMEEHARDLLALLDAVDAEQVDLLLGWSMGGFVAAVAGAMAPERFPTLLMVDGGFPLVKELPAGVTVEMLIASVIGPAMERLDMRFANVEAYFDYWRQHPALQNDWSEELEDYLRYDLTGIEPELRSSVRREAIIGDVETQLLGPTVPDALLALRQPVHLVTAERGIMNGPPLYNDALLRPWQEQMPNLSVSPISGVNHYTILQSETGARAVASEIHRLLEAI